MYVVGEFRGSGRRERRRAALLQRGDAAGFAAGGGRLDRQHRQLGHPARGMLLTLRHYYVSGQGNIYFALQSSPITHFKGKVPGEQNFEVQNQMRCRTSRPDILLPRRFL